MRPNISIIVPIYNVELYIEKCLYSLLNQSLENIEYIFIDDCSTDNSIDILFRVLERFPTRKPYVKVIRHELNQGVSQSRQDGVDYATGEYIIHCDPDDWVEHNMYELLYKKAIKCKSDITICGHIEERDEMSIEICPFLPKTSKDIFQYISTGKLKTYLWDKLIRRDFYNRIGVKFPSDVSLWEDMVVISILMLETDRIAILSDKLYHYRLTGCTSMTQNNTLAKVESKIKAVRYIYENLSRLGLTEKYKIELISLCLLAKHTLLTKKSSFNPSLWRTQLSYANNMILHTNLPYRYMLIYLLAKYRFDFILKLLSR